MNESIRIVPFPSLSDVGEQTAGTFEDLVDAERAGLFGALCLITRDRSEAEDVMQEAFLKVWERWEAVGDMEDPAGYLYRTALNLYRKRIRRASLALKRAIHSPLRLTSSRRSIHATRSSARSFALTPRQRLSIVLLDLLDYSSEEAGRVMEIKAATVRVLASTGQATVKRNVGDADE